MSTGISIALITVGAILTFALEREAEGINLDTVGIILMLVGVLGLVISALFWASWSPYGRERRSTVIREREGPVAAPTATDPPAGATGATSISWRAVLTSPV